MRRLIKCTLVAIFLFAFMGRIAISSDSDSVTKDQLQEDYEKMAFTGLQKQLVKLDSNSTNTINIHCFAPECDNLTKLLGEYMRAPWLRVKRAAEADSSEVIIVGVVDPQNLPDKSLIGNDEIIRLTPEDKPFQDGTPDCHSYSVVRDRNEIKLVAMALSSKLGSDKILSCILVQLARSSGLILRPSFDKMWQPGGWFGLAGSSDLDKKLQWLSRILAIHFLPMTHHGMTIDEFRNAVKDMNKSEFIGELN